MTNQNFAKTVGSVFMLIALLHGLRLLNDWPIEIGGYVVPMWFSWAAIFIATYLGWQGFSLSQKK